MVSYESYLIPETVTLLTVRRVNATENEIYNPGGLQCMDASLFCAAHIPVVIFYHSGSQPVLWRVFVFFFERLR